MKSKLIIGGIYSFLILVLSGCVTPPKSYVDPGFDNITYEDLTRRSEPHKWRVFVEFQRNGTHLPEGDSELRGHVKRVIRASGVAVPTENVQAPELNVVVNNYGDRGSAAAKGIGTGLTLGLVGNTVTDVYEMTISLWQKGKGTQQTKYRHSLHTAIGNESVPPGVEPMTPNAAFGNVVEQMLLRALKELEQNNVLSFSPFEDFLSWVEDARKRPIQPSV